MKKKNCGSYEGIEILRARMRTAAQTNYIITSNIQYINVYRVQNESRLNVHLLQNTLTMAIVDDSQQSGRYPSHSDVHLGKWFLLRMLTN